MRREQYDGAAGSTTLTSMRVKEPGPSKPTRARSGDLRSASPSAALKVVICRCDPGRSAMTFKPAATSKSTNTSRTLSDTAQWSRNPLGQLTKWRPSAPCGVGRPVRCVHEVQRHPKRWGGHARRSAALAEMGSVAASRNLKMGEQGTRASQEDGPGAAAPSRSRALPRSSVRREQRSSQNSRDETIEEIKHWDF